MSKTPKIYVDDAFLPFGRMKMCHLWSADLQALNVMAENLGVRRWLQDRRADFIHYDICKSKRDRAIEIYGAIPVTVRELIKLVNEHREHLTNDD